MRRLTDSEMLFSEFFKMLSDLVPLHPSVHILHYPVQARSQQGISNGQAYEDEILDDETHARIHAAV